MCTHVCVFLYQFRLVPQPHHTPLTTTHHHNKQTPPNTTSNSARGLPHVSKLRGGFHALLDYLVLCYGPPSIGIGIGGIGAAMGFVVGGRVFPPWVERHEPMAWERWRCVLCDFACCAYLLRGIDGYHKKSEGLSMNKHIV